MTSQSDAPTAAVVGLGRMGVRHLQVLSDLGMDIVGLADRSADVARIAAESFAPKAAIFDDAGQMFSELNPRAVVISTTADSHFELVKAAAEAGASWILCEKPIAVSLATATEMDAICQSHGAILAVNHQMRFMPNYYLVKELVGSEGLGPLASIVVAGSNFGLAMNASHFFEVFRYMTDEPAEAIFSWLDDEIVANPRGPQFEDRSGRVAARNSRGQSIYIDFSVSAGWGLNVTYICKYGQIQVDELGGEMRISERLPEHRDLPTSRYGMPHAQRLEIIPPTDATAPTRALWESMLAGRDYPSAFEGTHALACVVAAHVSNESGGQWIRLDGLDSHKHRVFRWA